MTVNHILTTHNKENMADTVVILLGENVFNFMVNVVETVNLVILVVMVNLYELVVAIVENQINKVEPVNYAIVETVIMEINTVLVLNTVVGVIKIISSTKVH